MSALRRLDQRPFDVLAALLLNEDFSILRAALIPIDIVKAQSVFTPHVNAHRFMFRESIWSIRDVEDVTDAMKRASALA